MQTARQNLAAGQRAVVFCRSRPTCERIADQLGCQLYHRTFEAKEESLDSWIDGTETVMIATSALGTGVDIDSIRLVVHLSRPHGIMDFVQEVGRAGRNGDPVRSLVLLGKREMQ
jgi:ATP-dependent DNA helicase RecQ